MKNKFQQEINKRIDPIIKKNFNIKNNCQVPCFKKITINAGFGKYRLEKELVEKLSKELTIISGQVPKIIKAKKSIAGFKLRAGEPVAFMITLRGKKMYDFIYKLINVTFPAIRDFRGFDTKFDQQGNFSIGIKDHAVFPEITFEDLNKSFDLGINFTVKSQSDQQTKFLLGKIGFPFKK